MKTFLLYHFLPIVILTCGIVAWQKGPVPDKLLAPAQKYYRNLSYPEKKSGYYKKLDSLGAYSDLIYALSNKSVVCFGSSEFETPLPALPQNFIPQNTDLSVLSIGSAGFQSMCIYNQLASVSNLLNGARIVIFVSPMWYTNTWENGAALDVFLSNSNIFVSTSIMSNPGLPEKYKKYDYDYIDARYNRIINPSIDLQEIAYIDEEHTGVIGALNNFRNNIALSSVKKLDLYLQLQAQYLNLSSNSKIHDILQVPFSKHQITDSITARYTKNINWDSLFSDSRAEAFKYATNNTMTMRDDKYIALKKSLDHAAAEKSTLMPDWVPADVDTAKEFKDFKMLCSLLKNQKANATFVIVPVNPFFYNHMDKWQTLTRSLEQEIRKYDFDCYNPLAVDTARYEKGMLLDEQHFGNLGWYHVDKFITEKYIENGKNRY